MKYQVLFSLKNDEKYSRLSSGSHDWHLNYSDIDPCHTKTATIYCMKIFHQEIFKLTLELSNVKILWSGVF